MMSNAPWGGGTAVLFVAVAAAYGSVIGSLVDGVPGATIMGSIVAIAVLLTTAPHVSTVTAVRAAATMAIASAIGFVNSEVLALPIADSGIGDVAWGEIAQRCGAAAARGAVQIALPATVLGLVLAGRGVAVSGPPVLTALLLGAWWGSGRLFLLLPEVVKATLSRITLLPLPSSTEPAPLMAWWAAGLVLLGLLGWAGLVRGNRLALGLGASGAVAGGLAFALAEAMSLLRLGPLGSVLGVSAHSWLTALQAEPLRLAISGLAWGGILGWAAWRNRAAYTSTPDVGAIRLPWEVGLIAIHAIMLCAALFAPRPPSSSLLDAYAKSALLAGAIPIACSLTGRLTPWMLLFPVAIGPLVGTAVRHTVYSSQSLSAEVGWFMVAAVPISLACAVAAWAMGHDEEHLGQMASVPLGMTFLVCVVTVAGLAAAILDFSWFWTQPTPHTATLTAISGLASVLAIGSIRLLWLAPRGPAGDGNGHGSRG